MLKVYTFSGARAQVVAGLQVISGRLRTKASNSASDSTSSGYVYRITRNGKVVLPESRGDTELKRMKATVNEVRSYNLSIIYDYIHITYILHLYICTVFVFYMTLFPYQLTSLTVSLSVMIFLLSLIHI